MRSNHYAKDAEGTFYSVFGLKEIQSERLKMKIKILMKVAFTI